MELAKFLTLKDTYYRGFGKMQAAVNLNESLWGSAWDCSIISGSKDLVADSRSSRMQSTV